jgi:hypothetical protein
MLITRRLPTLFAEVEAGDCSVAISRASDSELRARQRHPYHPVRDRHEAASPTLKRVKNFSTGVGER